MIGKILYVLLLLTCLTGVLRRKKLHRDLALLTTFTLFLHIFQHPYFTPLTLSILVLFFLTLMSSSSKSRIKYRKTVHAFLALATILLATIHAFPFFLPSKVEFVGKVIPLPSPSFEGRMSVEEALFRRRSIRDYSDEEISLKDLSQLLWAAQGITSKEGKRTAPSAGMTYPIEVYVLVRRVEGLKKGVYHYSPYNHSLSLIKAGDFSSSLASAALNQRWVKEASLNLIVAADFSRTMGRYGERGERYVYLEAGHVGQNVYLQATALNLGCVVVGAFNDDEVQEVLSIPRNHRPIYIIPVGHPASS